MTETERQNFVKAQQSMLDRYGIDAQSQFIDIPSTNGQAHVLVTGEGPAVVMVNGIGTPGAMWAPLMAELKGFQLFVVDLPAYGLSDSTPGFTEDLRNNAVRFLSEVLAGLNLKRPMYVANSLGSLWISWLALDHPEHVSAMIHVGCPATVLNTGAPFPMCLLSVRPLGKLLTRLQPPSPKQVEQLSKMVKQYPLVPELADLLLATERLPGFRHTFLETAHKLIRVRGSRQETQLSGDQLSAIHVPTLIFWGKDDPFGSPKVGEHMAAAMPTAKLHVIDGGHAPWLTQSRQIGPVASQFLEQHA